MMAEVFTWPEGSAYFWSGDSTNSALLTFAQNATVSLSIARFSYRPPTATQRTYIELNRQAALSISQGFSQKSMLNYGQNAAGGAIHCHITHGNVGTSGGMYLWTGEIQNMNIAGIDGQAITLSMQAQFEKWSAY
jgi:hypothetical protein